MFLVNIQEMSLIQVNTDNYDTDPDSDTLTVTAIRTGSDEGSGTPGSVGGALTGTYGDLTIAADGSYNMKLQTTVQWMHSMQEIL